MCGMTMTAGETAADQDAISIQVSSEVRAWLARRQLTQRNLASHLGISATSLSFRMKGKTPWSIVELAQVADWLDISLAQLLGDQLLNEKTPRPMGEGSDEGSGGGARSRDLTIVGSPARQHHR